MAKKLKNNAQSPAQDLLLLERVSRLARAASFEHGLHPAQWEALRYLASANIFSNSPKALARYLGATKGTVSQTLAALVAKGLKAGTHKLPVVNVNIPDFDSLPVVCRTSARLLPVVNAVPMTS